MKPLAYHIHRISKQAFLGAGAKATLANRLSHHYGWQRTVLAGLYLFSAAFFCNGLCLVALTDSGHHCCPADTSSDDSASSENLGFTEPTNYGHSRADSLCRDSHPRTLTNTVQVPKHAVAQVVLIPPATGMLRRSSAPYHNIKSLESSNILLRTQKMLV